ncbi:MAG TPA: hypothetical protein PKM65_00920 [Spirochaetota bacterium]|nr:hypothetical protein [Spirochaetota bacterium]HNT11621.1 hypothetical protein [Spirochaetota bacterium]
MPLTDTEVQQLIVKLREKYDDYARRHNKTWFNRDAFEERLQYAIGKRMNLEGFILAEIKNFEEVRQKYDKKKSAKASTGEIDRILEENRERIGKYPEVKFHPKADFEITRFYGALGEFAEYQLPVLSVIIEERETKQRAYDLEEAVNVLALRRGERHPKPIEDHGLLLGRPGVTELDIDRSRAAYMREAAFSLHEIADFCQELIGMRVSGWEEPLRFDTLRFEEGRRRKITDNYRNHTTYGAIVRVRESALAILEDFRLTAFRRAPAQRPF